MASSSDESGKRVTICVYPGTSPAHLEAARALARAFHEHNVQLVYGGGTTGIMGEVARTLVELAGPEAVYGVIPDALIKYERAEKAQHELQYGRTVVVPDMHSRKQLMAERVIAGAPGSGFCALSGGYGTAEELLEMTTWNQLGIHGVGVCVLNVEGFYDGLLDWIRRAVSDGFVPRTNENIIVEAKTPQEVIEKLANYRVAEGRFKLDWSKK